MKHGLEIVARELQAKFERAESDGARERLSYLRGSVLKAIEKEFLVMVASLCQGPDDLALWRPYARDGAGCSVGVDLNEMMSQDAEVPGSADIARMVYDEKDKAAQVVSTIDDHLTKGDELRGRADPRVLRDQEALSLLTQASLLTATLKHPAYAAEREWRLLQMILTPEVEKSVRYRTTSTGWLVPYVDIDVSSALVEVVLGPRHPRDAVDAWQRWLKHVGREHIKVRRSEAPYQ